MYLQRADKYVKRFLSSQSAPIVLSRIKLIIRSYTNSSLIYFSRQNIGIPKNLPNDWYDPEQLDRSYVGLS